MNIERITFAGDIDAEKLRQLALVAGELGLRMIDNPSTDEDSVHESVRPDTVIHDSAIDSTATILDTPESEAQPEFVTKREFFEFARAVLPESENERETRARFSAITRTWFGLARVAYDIEQDSEAQITSPLVEALGSYPKFGILPTVTEHKNHSNDSKVKLDEQNADKLDFESAVNYVVALAAEWTKAESAYCNSDSMQQFINKVKPDSTIGAPGLAALSQYLSTKSIDPSVIEKLQFARDFFVQKHKNISRDGQTWLNFAE